MPAADPRTSEPKKLPGIFISYRRSDTPDAVGRVYDRLVSEFGKSRVFKDVDSIPLGQDFRGHLNDIVGGCVAVLAIIGPKWTDIRNEAGQRRLEDPDDFVRIELEAALARSVSVVPVLVGHAPMPGTSQLPASLASLAFRQSIEVRPDPDFHNDATRLVSALWAIVDPNAQRTLPSARTPSRSWLPWLGALATVATLAAIAFAIPALKYLREIPPPETRIAISLPVAEEGPRAFALSPDGRQIVYVATGDAEQRLWLRSLDTTTALPLPGTGGGHAPFWSPDGRSIAFFAGGALKQLDIGSGQLQLLATAGDLLGAWGAGGDILFNPGINTALVRIAATGGPVTEVTKLDAQTAGHVVLGFLPDGKHFMFGMVGDGEVGTYLGSLDGSPPVRLTGGGGPVAYLPSGWLLMHRLESITPPRGSLVAQRLDVRSARLTGEPVTIAGGVSGASVSASGLMAFRTAQVAGQRQLTWVDRSGAELGTIGDADGTLDYPRVAPDGRRVLVSRVRNGNRDIWLLDGERSGRMTLDASQDAWPVWSPDGQRIAFGSDRSGKLALYVKSAGDVGGEEPLDTNEQVAVPTDWSADDLMYTGVAREDDSDIRIRRMTGEHEPADFLNTPFIETWGQFSPDGHWVAYMSNESGQFEVFVRAFPSRGTAVRWIASTAGGTYPTWSPDGREIYYLNPAGEMMATPVTVNASALVPGTPVKLFDARVAGGGVADRTGRQYDVAPDGRFLINREPDADAVPTITLIQNWNPDASK